MLLLKLEATSGGLQFWWSFHMIWMSKVPTLSEWVTLKNEMLLGWDCQIPKIWIISYSKCKNKNVLMRFFQEITVLNFSLRIFDFFSESFANTKKKNIREKLKNLWFLEKNFLNFVYVVENCLNFWHLAVPTQEHFVCLSNSSQTVCPPKASLFDVLSSFLKKSSSSSYTVVKECCRIVREEIKVEYNKPFKWND